MFGGRSRQTLEITPREGQTSETTPGDGQVDLTVRDAPSSTACAIDSDVTYKKHKKHCIDKQWIFVTTGVLLLIIGFLMAVVYFSIRALTTSLEFVEVIPTYAVAILVICDGILVLFLCKRKDKLILCIISVVGAVCVLVCVAALTLTIIKSLSTLLRFTSCRYSNSNMRCNCYTNFDTGNKNATLSADAEEYIFFNTLSCSVILENLRDFLYTLSALHGAGALVCLQCVVMCGEALRGKRDFTTMENNTRGISQHLSHTGCMASENMNTQMSRQIALPGQGTLTLLSVCRTESLVNANPSNHVASQSQRETCESHARPAVHHEPVTTACTRETTCTSDIENAINNNIENGEAVGRQNQSEIHNDGVASSSMREALTEDPSVPIPCTCNSHLNNNLTRRHTNISQLPQLLTREARSTDLPLELLHRGNANLPFNLTHRGRCAHELPPCPISRQSNTQLPPAPLQRSSQRPCVQLGQRSCGNYNPGQYNSNNRAPSHINMHFTANVGLYSIDLPPPYYLPPPYIENDPAPDYVSRISSSEGSNSERNDSNVRCIDDMNSVVVETVI